MTADKSLAHGMGPLFGVFYVAIGVLGFVVMGFQGSVHEAHHTLLGLPIDPLANLAHAGIGVLLVLMTTRTPAPGRRGRGPWRRPVLHRRLRRRDHGPGQPHDPLDARWW
jgi:hypothetical protein